MHQQDLSASKTRPSVLSVPEIQRKRWIPYVFLKLTGPQLAIPPQTSQTKECQGNRESPPADDSACQNPDFGTALLCGSSLIHPEFLNAPNLNLLTKPH